MIVYTTGNGIEWIHFGPILLVILPFSPEYEIPNYGKKFIPLTKEKLH